MLRPAHVWQRAGFVKELDQDKVIVIPAGMITDNDAEKVPEMLKPLLTQPLVRVCRLADVCSEHLPMLRNRGPVSLVLIASMRFHSDNRCNRTGRTVT